MIYAIGILAISLVLISLGYYIGKTITSVKYGAKIDRYKAMIDVREERIHDLARQLKREMEKSYK